MNRTLPHKNRAFLYVFLPIAAFVSSVFLIGFVFSIRVSSEYEEHNAHIRFGHIVHGLKDTISDHTKYFRKIAHGDLTEKKMPYFSLEVSNELPLWGRLNALLINQERAVVAISYDGDRTVFYKGYAPHEAQILADRLFQNVQAGSPRPLLDTENLVQYSPFSDKPHGFFIVTASKNQGTFIGDFVLHKLWPYVLGAGFLSLILTLATYRFIRNRYNEVAHERTRFSGFAEASSDWFWEMDENLRFSYFSERFTEVTGVPQEKLLGVTREENGNPGASQEVWQQQLSDLKAHRPFKNFEHPRTKADGSVVWLSINGIPVFDGNRFVGYRGVGRDITQRVEIEEKLLRALDEAEQANQIKSDFLANMSHELRTPLNAIIGFSQMMIDEVFGEHKSPKYQEYSGDIRDSALHLLDLINDVLDISKIESGEMHLNEQVFGLPEIIQESFGLIEARVQSKKQKFILQMDADVPLLNADRRMVKQILLNVLSNAQKFTHHGGTLTLRVEYAPGEDLVILMEDNGIGISNDDLSRVLEPFNQGTRRSTIAQEGTGLGLSLVKLLMDLHGGRLSIFSELDKGTIVRLTFPANRLVDVDEQVTLPHARGA